MPSGRSSTRGSFPQNALNKKSGGWRESALSGHAGLAALAFHAHVVGRVAPREDRVVEQLVELGVQPGAVGDPEFWAELEPPLAHRGAQLDHHLGFAREV